MKRIIRDLKELSLNPIPGIEVCICDDDLFNIHANILVQDGPYKDMIMHIELNLSKDYPYVGPVANMGGNFPLSSYHHAHIHEGSYNNNGSYAYEICNDMMSNYASWFRDEQDRGIMAKGTGWSSSYTLTTILIQMSTFFIDPDYSEMEYTPKLDIEGLRSLINEYKCQKCQMSTCNKKIVNENKTIINDNYSQKIICSITKELFTDESIFGYPFYNFTAYNEFISFEAYLQNSSSENITITEYTRQKLSYYDRQTVLGEEYKYMLPLYINEKHFQLSENLRLKMLILASNIPLINDFDINNSEIIGKIIIDIIPKLIINLLYTNITNNGKLSVNTIYGYFQLMMLWKKYVKYNKYIEQHIIELFNNGNFLNNKSVIELQIQLLAILSCTNGYSHYNSIKQKLAKKFIEIQLNGQNLDTYKLENNKRANSIYLFLLETINIFNDENIKLLDINYSFPTKTINKLLKSRSNIIVRSLKNTSDFFIKIGL